jgi:uncharacterized damage-inducible protein DinB
MKKFRNNGAIGALLDEYEKALTELKNEINSLTVSELLQVVDAETNDLDCRSIQTILAHVVCSGYGYAIYIRNHEGEQLDFRQKIKRVTVEAYCQDLDEMFAFNEQVFADYPNVNLEEKVDSKKIKTRWGQVFDVDQLMEHAIVHILRHRRQIERFKIKMEK